MKKKKQRVAKSKGHWEVERILKKIGYNVTNEFLIEDKPYDMYVPNLNLIIEYYGDRWHYHKSKYPADFYDHVKNQFAWQKWHKDKNKINVAKQKGYGVIIIWQYDWKRLSNKRRHVEKIIKGYSEK